MAVVRVVLAAIADRVSAPMVVSVLTRGVGFRLTFAILLVAVGGIGRPDSAEDNRCLVSLEEAVASDRGSHTGEVSPVVLVFLAVLGSFVLRQNRSRKERRHAEHSDQCHGED